MSIENIIEYIVGFLLIGVPIALGWRGKSKEIRLIEKYCLGQTYSDVINNDQYGVLEIGLDIKVLKVDTLDLSKFSTVKLKWLVLNPGKHVLSLSFETKSSVSGFTNSLSISPQIKEVNISDGGVQRFSALINGLWHAQWERDVMHSPLNPLDGLGFSPFTRSATVEIRLVDCEFQKESLFNQIKKDLAQRTIGNSGFSIPHCFLKEEIIDNNKENTSTE